MTQRVQEYLNVKLGRVDETKLKKIIQMQQFKVILNENLDEFKTWYTKQIEKRVYTFSDQAVIDYYDSMLKPSNSLGYDDDNFLDSFSNTQ
jgi:pectin methylesterase-like acyl-CoA thioesterase